jgi:tetratricopeptide (TPR) repeat protein
MLGYDSSQGEITMQRIPLISAIALLAVAPAAFAVPDADGNLVSEPAPDISQDAAMMARVNYNIGYEGVQKMARLEMEGASLKGARAQQNHEEVLAGFAKARENFRTAVGADPNMKEGWNLLGYTSRRLGDYEESLQAYDKALALAPDYPEAIEYRAELFLLTGRLEQTRQAYATLLQAEPSYAGVLKTSMKDFLKSKKPFPASVTEAERDAFVKWVKSL